MPLVGFKQKKKTGLQKDTKKENPFISAFEVFTYFLHLQKDSLTNKIVIFHTRCFLLLNQKLLPGSKHVTTYFSEVIGPWFQVYKETKKMGVTVPGKVTHCYFNLV